MAAVLRERRLAFIPGCQQHPDILAHEIEHFAVVLWLHKDGRHRGGPQECHALGWQ